MLADVIIFVYEVPFIFSQKIITKYDGIITNCDSLVYYKVRWTVNTNCDGFFITNCDRYYNVRWIYYKLRQLLQSAMIITNCDSNICLNHARYLKSPDRPLALRGHVTNACQKFTEHIKIILHPKFERKRI